MLDWNDLKWFLAVAEAQSFRKAAEATGLNHTTLSRRVRVLETELGTALLERSPTGLVLTAAGVELHGSCQAIRDDVNDLRRRLSGQDQRAEGRVTLTYPEGFSTDISLAIAGLAQAHPGISITHIHTEDLVNLTRRESDVAVRAAYEPPDDLLGRRVGRIRWGVYGARSRYSEAPDTLVPREHDWIGFGGRWEQAPPSRWLRENVPTSHIRAVVDTPSAIRELTASGLGLGVLMAVDGDRDPRLRFLGDWPGPALPPNLWVLVHPDVRKARRVRVVADTLFEHLRAIPNAFV